MRPEHAFYGTAQMPRFELTSEFRPTGDQPEAIAAIIKGLGDGLKQQTLLGATGTGKTYVISNVIEQVQKPTLVLAHNKTLAAQLYAEFSEFFPKNAVEYFVSYYDYYQPEAYVPRHDLYIEKEADINEEIDRLRLAATTSLLSRRDVIIVASVSAIYGLGSPEQYEGRLLRLIRSVEYPLGDAVRRLVDIQYERNDLELLRGSFRVRGDIVELLPAYEETAYRVEFFGEEIENLLEVEPMTGEVLAELERLTVYPAKHFVVSQDRIERAVTSIRAELAEWLEKLQAEEKILEAERLNSRTRYDMELLLEVG